MNKEERDKRIKDVVENEFSIGSLHISRHFDLTSDIIDIISSYKLTIHEAKKVLGECQELLDGIYSVE